MVISVGVVSTFTFDAVGPLGLEVGGSIGACIAESLVGAGGEVDSGALLQNVSSILDTGAHLDVPGIECHRRRNR